MCKFFSFVTDPINHPAEYYFFDWEYRKANLDDGGVDSHSHICLHFKLNEDVCNKYEFIPLTKEFTVDQINSKRDDSESAEAWVNRLDFKTIVEPLIIKPIINPFELPKVSEPTEEQIGWLKEWASVWDTVWDAVWYAVRDAVWYAVGDAVWYAVRDAVGDEVWYAVRDVVSASVGDEVGDDVVYAVGDVVWGYISSFFNIEYKYDFLSAVKLWESGLVPSFDGTTWRLHSGKDADVVFEWKPKKGGGK